MIGVRIYSEGENYDYLLLNLPNHKQSSKHICSIFLHWTRNPKHSHQFGGGREIIVPLSRLDTSNIWHISIFNTVVCTYTYKLMWLDISSFLNSSEKRTTIIWMVPNNGEVDLPANPCPKMRWYFPREGGLGWWTREHLLPNPTFILTKIWLCCGSQDVPYP